MYQPNNNLKRNALFLANLSNECNEGDLYNVFSPFGEIAGIKIIRGQYSNKSTYGFVNFSYQSAANEATRRMNGFMMFGLPLSITNNRELPARETSNFKTIRTAQIHISFISDQIEDMVSNDYLHELFSSFGEVSGVSIVKQNVYNRVIPHRQSGHGFVHFAFTHKGIESAFNAAKTLSRRSVDNIVFDCELSHQIREFLFSEKALEKNLETKEETLNMDRLNAVQMPTPVESASDLASASKDVSCASSDSSLSTVSGDLTDCESDGESTRRTASFSSTASTSATTEVKRPLPRGRYDATNRDATRQLYLQEQQERIVQKYGTTSRVSSSPDSTASRRSTPSSPRSVSFSTQSPSAYSSHSASPTHGPIPVAPIMTPELVAYQQKLFAWQQQMVATQRAEYEKYQQQMHMQHHLQSVQMTHQAQMSGGSGGYIPIQPVYMTCLNAPIYHGVTQAVGTTSR